MKNLPRYQLLVVLCLSCLLLAGHAHGLVNGEAPAEDDTRFDAVAAFSRTAWLTENPEDKHVHNWFGAGVLIAPDVVLIAKHLLPAPVAQGKVKGRKAFSVRFRRHADGGLGSKPSGPGSYHQVTIQQWVCAPNADLALGILSKPVEHIEPVQVLLDDAQVFSGRRCMLAAWGSESPWRGGKVPRHGLKIGENTVTRNGGFLRVDSYKTEPREDKDGKINAYIIDENAVPNMHDSGGSMFLFDEDGKPVLAGIISTYSGGPFLASAVKDSFPLEAATRGGKAMLDALKENAKEQSE